MLSARTKQGRSRGRPAGADSVDVRGDILDSAEELFARKGFSAVSVREIAQRGNTTPAMIHYYFGSKTALLKQVLERATEPLASAIAGMRASGKAPARQIASLLIQTLAKRPNLPLLMLREVMLPGGTMQEHFLQYLAPRLGGAIPDLLAKEQADGRVRSDVDPRISALMILSLCIFPFVVKGTAQPALDINLDQDGLARLEKHVVRLLDGGLAR